MHFSEDGRESGTKSQTCWNLRQRHCLTVFPFPVDCHVSRSELRWPGSSWLKSSCDLFLSAAGKVQRFLFTATWPSFSLLSPTPLSHIRGVPGVSLPKDVADLCWPGRQRTGSGRWKRGYNFFSFFLTLTAMNSLYVFALYMFYLSHEIYYLCSSHLLYQNIFKPKCWRSVKQRAPPMDFYVAVVLKYKTKNRIP